MSTASIHASAVMVGGIGVLIRGPSGSGKSRLALSLLLAARARIVEPAQLIGDDRIVLSVQGSWLFAACAPELSGLIEVRGVGIRRWDLVGPGPLNLVVDLDADDAARMPEEKALKTTVSGVELRRIPVGKGHDPLPLVVGFLTTT
ncbi:MAG: serine kinase [Pseudomonadota bacterium]